MLRGARGFDIDDFHGVPLQFNGYASTFNQSGMVTGRDGIGLALNIINTAFGQTNYTAIFDNQQTWGMHCDFQIPSGSYPTMEWFRIGTASGPQLSLIVRPTGKIDLVLAGGAVIDTSSVPLSGIGQWDTIELLATFGITGTVELRFNGTRVAGGNVNFGSPPYPDRLTFRWQGFPPGLVIDNYAMWDGRAGDRFSAFTGRLRITSHLPTADQTAGWICSSGATRFSLVNEQNLFAFGAPDGDHSYITPDPVGPDQLFTVAPSTCFGAIYGLAWNVCARPTSGAPVLDLIYQGKTSELVVGNCRPTFVGQWNTNALAALKDYLVYQVVSTASLDTGALWTDAEIKNGAFGVGAAITPTLRVTQFYMEKITSLVAQKFDCGGSSYSF